MVLVTTVLAGCVPPQLYTEEDKRAIAYYEAQTPGSREPDDSERLSNTDVILLGLQVCKMVEESIDTDTAYKQFARKYKRYAPGHRRVIFATGVEGYCPEAKQEEES